MKRRFGPSNCVVWLFFPVMIPLTLFVGMAVSDSWEQFKEFLLSALFGELE